MPAGCVKCPGGEIQCGSDTTELCAASGGWTPAGALCLQVFVRKHPKTGNCLVRIEVNAQASCDGDNIIAIDPIIPQVIAKQVNVKKRSPRKK